MLVWKAMRSQRRAAPRDTGMDSPDLSLAQFWYEDETLAALLAQVFFSRECLVQSFAVMLKVKEVRGKIIEHNSTYQTHLITCDSVQFLWTLSDGS